MAGQRAQPRGGRITLDPGTPEECELLPLGDGIVLKRGDLLRLETCGGRGWGDPLERDPERGAVLGDVLTPYGFAETNLRERFLASSADPWLGTGQIGRSASAPSALRASSRRRWDLLRLLGYRAPPDGHL